MGFLRTGVYDLTSPFSPGLHASYRSYILKLSAFPKNEIHSLTKLCKKTYRVQIMQGNYWREINAINYIIVLPFPFFKNNYQQ